MALLLNTWAGIIPVRRQLDADARGAHMARFPTARLRKGWWPSGIAPERGGTHCNPQHLVLLSFLLQHTLRSERRRDGNRFTIGTVNGSGTSTIRKLPTRGDPEEANRWANDRCGPAAWHLPSRSSRTRTRRKMTEAALSGGTSDAMRPRMRAWWCTGAKATRASTTCPMRSPAW